jgi:hypothetical protein
MDWMKEWMNVHLEWMESEQDGRSPSELGLGLEDTKGFGDEWIEEV